MCALDRRWSLLAVALFLVVGATPSLALDVKADVTLDVDQNQLSAESGHTATPTGAGFFDNGKKFETQGEFRNITFGVETTCFAAGEVGAVNSVSCDLGYTAPGCDYPFSQFRAATVAVIQLSHIIPLLTTQDRVTASPEALVCQPDCV